MSAITEKKQVMKEVTVIIGIKCDVCGKAIKGKYWTLLTSHSDWGNDSCESIEQYDLCSKKCIAHMLKEYYEDCEYSHTQKFELEQDYYKGGE